MSLEPLAFMSYSRADDEHDNNRITEFCRLLMNEIQAQTGKHFHIFQDTKDINVGEQWQRRLDEEIDNCTFLIPIITPRFFESKACTSEVRRFVSHEQQLGRDDLIIPIYYIKADVIEDKNSSNAIAKLINQRQRIDWRDKRFLDFNKPDTRAEFATLAEQIVKRTKRLEQTKVTNSPSEPEPAPNSQPKGPKQYLVDCYHQGDFVTIGEAINAAEPGSTIVVKEGLYQERLDIKKPLKIIGEGQKENIVIEFNDNHTILFESTAGLLENLTISNTSSTDYHACIGIYSGRLEIKSCDVTCAFNGVSVTNNASPKITNSKITSINAKVLLFFDYSNGQIENNSIHSDKHWAIYISGQSNPSIKNNQIKSLEYDAVYITDQAKGHIENNQIFAKDEAIAIYKDASPTIGDNQIEIIE